MTAAAGRLRGHGISVLAALLTILSLAVSGCSTPRPSATDVMSAGSVPRIAESFQSGGRRIGVEFVRGAGAGPLPAVVMLHGASGVGSGYLLFPHAGAIAARGIHVFVVHYYDGLSGGGDPSSTAHFAQRERTIADAVDYVRSRSDVDPNRIGLFGLSLGGFHALSLAAHDPRIAAVVDMMGAMPRSVAMDRVRHMPPVLILHGAQDRVVPPRRMEMLVSLLERIGTPYELKVYMEAGHSLAGDAHADSVWRTADFFDRQLNGAVVALTVPRLR